MTMSECSLSPRTRVSLWPSPVSPTPAATQLHDTLVPTGSSITTGTFASGSQSQYSAPFDDFTSTANTTIRSVEWQGYYCNTLTPNPIPDPVATSFIIRIAPNDAGAQRPPFDAFGTTATTATVQVTTVAASAARQQLEFTRMDSGCGGGNSAGWPAAYYRYSADLSSPYAVTAGSRYWVAIYPVMPAGPVSWSWRFGLQDNSFSIYWLNGTLTTFFGDRAFAVHDR